MTQGTGTTRMLVDRRVVSNPHDAAAAFSAAAAPLTAAGSARVAVAQQRELRGAARGTGASASRKSCES